MRFRVVERHEAERLTDLMRRLFVASYGHSSTPENVQAFLDGVYTPEKQRAEIDNPHIYSCVLEDGDAWAGFTQIRFAASKPDAVPLANGAELGRIYLDPAYQGRALGGRLLGHVEAVARERGRDGFWASVWQQAPQAIAFYRKNGFEIVGTTTFFVGAEGTPDWIMAKRFAQA